MLLVTTMLIVSACVTTSVNDVAFKDRVSNSLAQVDLVANNVLIESLSEAELMSAVVSLDNIITFRSFWNGRITDAEINPLTVGELNVHYKILLTSYKALEAIVQTHWGEFNKLQQISFKMTQADLKILNVTYQTAVASQSLTLATDQAIAMANLALRIVAIP